MGTVHEPCGRRAKVIVSVIDMSTAELDARATEHAKVDPPSSHDFVCTIKSAREMACYCYVNLG